MSAHQWYIENRGAFVAGSLDAKERRAFADHLARCEECTEEVEALERDLGWLPLGVRPIPPRPAFKRDVLERVLARDRRWYRWAYPLAAAASLLLAVGVWASSRAQRADLIARVESRDMTVKALQDTLFTLQRAEHVHHAGITMKDRTGGLLIFDNPKTGNCSIVVHGLPPAPAGEVYRFWFMTESGMLRAAEFPIAQSSPVFITVERPHGKIMGASLTMERRDASGAEPSGVELAHLSF